MMLYSLGKSNKGDKSCTIDFLPRFIFIEKKIWKIFHGTKLYLAPKCLLHQSVSAPKCTWFQSVSLQSVSRAQVSLRVNCPCDKLGLCQSVTAPKWPRQSVWHQSWRRPSLWQPRHRTMRRAVPRKQNCFDVIIYRVSITCGLYFFTFFNYLSDLLWCLASWEDQTYARLRYILDILFTDLAPTIDRYIDDFE